MTFAAFIANLIADTLRPVAFERATMRDYQMYLQSEQSEAYPHRREDADYLAYDLADLDWQDEREAERVKRETASNYVLRVCPHHKQAKSQCEEIPCDSLAEAHRLARQLAERRGTRRASFLILDRFADGWAGTRVIWRREARELRERTAA